MLAEGPARPSSAALPLMAMLCLLLLLGTPDAELPAAPRWSPARCLLYSCHCLHTEID